jgi:hypothetical protein
MECNIDLCIQGLQFQDWHALVILPPVVFADRDDCFDNRQLSVDQSRAGESGNQPSLRMILSTEALA